MKPKIDDLTRSIKMTTLKLSRKKKDNTQLPKPKMKEETFL